MKRVWEESTIGKIAAPTRNALVGGPFGSNLVSSDYVTFGVPVIRGQNLAQGRWVTGDFVYVSEEKAGSLSANLACPDDVVLTQRGTLGQVAVVPPDSHPKYLVSQSQMKLTVDTSRADPLFIQYVLRSPWHQEYMRRNAIQTGVPHTNLGIFRETPLLLPSLPEQRVIVYMLGSLDDRIELNRQTNQTLDEIARTLFKSWLVDAVPSTHDAGQETWKKASIADLARYVNGRNFTKQASGVGRMVIRIAELRSGPGNSTVYNDVAAPHENIARPGDVLFAWSGSLGVYRWHRDEALINQHIFKVVLKGLPNWFVYYHLVRAMRFFQSIAANKATTMGHIQRKHLSEVPVFLPPKEWLNRAHEAIDPMFQLIHSKECESFKLARWRDALLPKLVSGKTRIKDAEKLVGGVA